MNGLRTALRASTRFVVALAMLVVALAMLVAGAAGATPLPALHADPQAVTVSGMGCWDWWGDDSPDDATRRGPQLLAVKRMVDRLTSPRGLSP